MTGTGARRVAAPLTWVIILGLVWALWGLGPAAAWAQRPTAEKGSPPVTYEGGGGDSLQTAVIIKGAPDHFSGIKAEYDYIETKFGRKNVDWQLVRQSLIREGGRAYDRMEIRLPDGSRKELYFDLTEFFGKF